MSVPYDAVLLIAFGGPTCPEEIRPFLARVTQGIPIPPARLEEVAHHYEAVGGKSPLNEITFRQAEALGKQLAAYQVALPVYVGMRNAAPFFVDTLKRMRDDGVKRILGFILSSHRTEASWERYQKNLADAQAELGKGAPAIEYCKGWHDHPLFIQTWAELIGAAMKTTLTPNNKPSVIFTAHSLPSAMAARSPYVEQLRTTARLVAAQLDIANWSVAYQSRSGRPSDPWLEPDIGAAIRLQAQQGAKKIVVAPIGFVCDHVEVLYDLDIEAKKLADNLAIEMVRPSCPNDYPTFVQMMAAVIQRKFAENEE